MRMTAPATLAVAIGLLAMPAVAVASATAPGLNPKDERQIGVLVDRFVKDAVLREDLRDAWPLIGPDLRDSTTKAKWIAGTGVTVEEYPARGHDFTHAWTGVVDEPGHVTISLMLHPAPGHPRVPQTAFNADVVKSHGRWIVNGFYPAASFFGNGRVVGPNDFGPGATGDGAALNKARIRKGWLFAVLGAVAALAVLGPAGLWIRAKRRDRRALAEYLATRPDAFRVRASAERLESLGAPPVPGIIPRLTGVAGGASGHPSPRRFGYVVRSAGFWRRHS